MLFNTKQIINQMTFLNTIYDDVNRTSNKIEKYINQKHYKV